MSDFEVHPIGTANRLAELEAMLTVVAGLVDAIRSPGAPQVKEPEPVDDEALVKVVVDWLHDPHYINSAEDDARELVRRLYAKAVQL